jgi:hypothetical protein
MKLHTAACFGHLRSIAEGLSVFVAFRWPVRLSPLLLLVVAQAAHAQVAPVANDDSDTTAEDTQVTTPVLANDTDADDPPSALTVTEQANVDTGDGTVSCSTIDWTCRRHRGDAIPRR